MGSAVASVSLPESRDEKLARLRQQLAAIPAKRRTSDQHLGDQPLGEQHPPVRTAREHHERADDVPTSTRQLPVEPYLAALLPGGGLPRGTVIRVAGAKSVLTSLVATATAAGAHVAIVGQPRLGLLNVIERGGDIAKIAIIDDPGADPVTIAAVLLDGIDVVICGLRGAAIPSSRARAVAARARAKGAVLLVVDGDWAGAQLTIEASVQGYRGTSRCGQGRIRGVDLAVGVRGRGRHAAIHEAMA